MCDDCEGRQHCEAEPSCRGNRDTDPLRGRWGYWGSGSTGPMGSWVQLEKLIIGNNNHTSLSLRDLEDSERDCKKAEALKGGE